MLEETNEDRKAYQFMSRKERMLFKNKHLFSITFYPETSGSTDVE
jgi:hypothetical protein